MGRPKTFRLDVRHAPFAELENKIAITTTHNTVQVQDSTKPLLQLYSFFYLQKNTKFGKIGNQKYQIFSPNRNPDPAQYYPNYSFHKTQTPSHSFHREKK